MTRDRSGYKNFIRSTVRKCFKRIDGSDLQTDIIVASSGRAGSTMVHDAIAKAVFGNLGKSLVKKFLASTFGTGFSRYIYDPVPFRVTKTHALPPKVKIDAKIIFIHGDPWDAVFSAIAFDKVKGEGWWDAHVHNLSGKRNACAFTNDVLNYERQIRLWSNYAKENSEILMVVAYEDLWRYEEKIWRFLGLPNASMPDQRKSRSSEAGVKVPELYQYLREVRSKTFSI